MALSVIVAFIVFVSTIIVGVVLLIVKASKSSNKTSPVQMVVPGWYPGVNDPRFVRWYDGRQWTDRIQPRGTGTTAG